MSFGEIASILSIIDWVKKLFRDNKNFGVVLSESVATRFICLFESHGVHRNQIPRFFGHGLTLADVQRDEVLLLKLSESMLDAACEMFAVRREWLDGAERQAHPTHEFYKQPAKFEQFLDKLLINQPDGLVTGVVLAPENSDWDANALLVLQELVGYVGEKQINRYHLCSGWLFSYWKARGYLAACVALAWKCKVYVHGVTTPKTFIEKLEHGETLLGCEGEGIFLLRGGRWYPEDMASNPSVYLDGVDPERDDFGIKSALSLWLRLNDEGWMDAGFGGDSRQSFERELAKYM